MMDQSANSSPSDTGALPDVSQSAAWLDTGSDHAIREMHAYMRLTREWDLRYEKMFKTGALSKWYSSVGNEATTVAAASAIEKGDALVSLHRDAGAILRHYVDIESLVPEIFPSNMSLVRKPLGGDSRKRLLRLACQMLGREHGFSAGHERSYHYNHMEPEHGLIHIGMISHLGSMIPVAAGAALSFQQQKSDRVAINFIGEGATSTGDFHEGLNIAAVWKLPFILIIENNHWAFSTPTSQQYACENLASRAIGYGMPGVEVDGNDPIAMHQVMQEAVKRARAGEGPTLVEAHVGRHRGHSEGDDSLDQVPGDELKGYLENDPMDLIENRLINSGIVSRAWLEEIREKCAALIMEVVDEAMSMPEPEPNSDRSIHAE